MDWIYANLYSCHKIIPPQRNKYKKIELKMRDIHLDFLNVPYVKKSW